jgi:hypothetical protein
MRRMTVSLASRSVISTVPCEVGRAVVERVAGQRFAGEGGDAAAVVVDAGVGLAGPVADDVGVGIAVHIHLVDRAVVDLHADDVVEAHAGLARRVGEELEVELDRLGADGAVIDADLHEVGDDVVALEVAAFERFDDVIVLADRAIVERPAAGGVVIRERGRGNEVEAEVPTIEQPARLEPLGHEEKAVTRLTKITHGLLLLRCARTG